MIDTKRLATDAGYWDEVAPDWATGAFVFELFTGEEIVLFGDGMVSFSHSENVASLYKSKAAIPRPTPKAESEERVDWLPPVGCECEVDASDINGPEDWRHCFVIGKDEDGDLVVKMYTQDNEDYFYSETRTRFRPILTKEQRQREELERAISSALDECYVNGGMEPSDSISDSDTEVYSAAVADAILARYNLEPKQ